MAQKYQLVLLLTLRDPGVKCAKELIDIIFHPLKNEIARIMSNGQGENVLIILEGFDELPNECRSFSSFFYQLISGKVASLCKANILITSRHWATLKLRHDRDIHLFQHIEIIGFTETQIDDYITASFKDESNIKSALTYLESYPHIRSSMYIPLTCTTVVEHIIQEKDREIQEKDRQLQENQHAITRLNQAYERKERELRVMQEQLRASEQLASEFQQGLQQKDKTISDLQQTISDHQRKIQQLEQQDMAARDQPQQQQPVSTPQTTVAAAQKDISEMTWREMKNAPEAIVKGAAVVHGNTAYFRAGGSVMVYSYQNVLGEEQWFRLPDNPNKHCALAVIDGFLTSVGGWNNGPSNTLFSLGGEGERRQWSEVFPPMPTPRGDVACATTEQALVVAGGTGRFILDLLNIVEVIDKNTKQWTTVSPLPLKCEFFSAAVCGDTVYLAGGFTGCLLSPSKSVFTCSLPDLLQPTTLGPRTQQAHPPSRNIIWREIKNLPVTLSTLVSFGGDLLAIGGRDNSDKPTSDVYRYDSHNDSWTVANQVNNVRYRCLAVSLPEDHLLIVVGGFAADSKASSSVEFLE